MALDANNGNVFGTARQFGLPRQTVSNWIRDREQIFEQSQTLDEERRLLINQIVDSLPGKVEQARLGDGTRALSTMLELQAMLTAKAAAEEVANSDVYEKLAALLERYAANPTAYMDTSGDETEDA